MWTWSKFRASRYFEPAIPLALMLIVVASAISCSRQVPRQAQPHQSEIAQSYGRAPAAPVVEGEEAADDTGPQLAQPTWSWRRFIFEANVADATIALVTLVLGFATWRLWEETRILRIDAARGIKAAEMNATAAMQQAAALLAMEQPEFRMTSAGLVSKEIGQEIAPVVPRTPLSVARLGVSLRYNNLGRTPAELLCLRIGWEVIFPGVQLPHTPHYRRTLKTYPGHFIGSGEQIPDLTTVRDNEIIIEQSQLDLINRGDLVLWVFTDWEYRNFLKEVRHLKFCGRWVPPKLAAERPTLAAFDSDLDNTPDGYLSDRRP